MLLVLLSEVWAGDPGDDPFESTSVPRLNLPLIESILESQKLRDNSPSPIRKISRAVPCQGYCPVVTRGCKSSLREKLEASKRREQDLELQLAMLRKENTTQKKSIAALEERCTQVIATSHDVFRVWSALRASLPGPKNRPGRKKPLALPKIKPPLDQEESFKNFPNRLTECHRTFSNKFQGARRFRAQSKPVMFIPVAPPSMNETLP